MHRESSKGRIVVPPFAKESTRGFVPSCRARSQTEFVDRERKAAPPRWAAFSPAGESRVREDRHHFLAHTLCDIPRRYLERADGRRCAEGRPDARTRRDPGARVMRQIRAAFQRPRRRRHPPRSRRPLVENGVSSSRFQSDLCCCCPQLAAGGPDVDGRCTKLTHEPRGLRSQAPAIHRILPGPPRSYSTALLKLFEDIGFYSFP